MKPVDSCTHPLRVCEVKDSPIIFIMTTDTEKGEAVKVFLCNCEREKLQKQVDDRISTNGKISGKEYVHGEMGVMWGRPGLKRCEPVVIVYA